MIATAGHVIEMGSPELELSLHARSTGPCAVEPSELGLLPIETVDLSHRCEAGLDHPTANGSARGVRKKALGCIAREVRKDAPGHEIHHEEGLSQRSRVGLPSEDPCDRSMAVVCHGGHDTMLELDRGLDLRGLKRIDGLPRPPAPQDQPPLDRAGIRLDPRVEDDRVVAEPRFRLFEAFDRDGGCARESRP
jgi:hypothetical protein